MQPVRVTGKQIVKDRPNLDTLYNSDDHLLEQQHQLMMYVHKDIVPNLFNREQQKN